LLDKFSFPIYFPEGFDFAFLKRACAHAYRKHQHPPVNAGQPPPLHVIDRAELYPKVKDLVKQILTFARQSDESVTVKPIQVSLIVKEVLKFIKSSIPATIQINHKLEHVDVLTEKPQMFNVMKNQSHV